MAPLVLGPFGGELDRLREDLASTPTVSPGKVSSGRVAVEGVAREHRETVAEPAGDGGALLVRYRREAPDGSVAETRTEAVAFVVEDETGRVLVDPRDALQGDGNNYVLVSERNTRRYVGGSDPAGAVPGGSSDEDGGSDPVDGGVDRADGESGHSVGSDDHGDGEWTHVQTSIRPGDRVFVLGAAEETPGGSPPHVLRPGEDGGFLVSDLSRAAVREQLAREAGPFDPSVWRVALLGLVAVAILAGVALFLYGIAEVVLF